MAEYQRLDEACHINMGQSPDSKSYNQEGVGLPFFQGNADFGAMHPETRVWCSSPTKIVEAGTLLISVRAPIGALNFAKERSCIGRGLAGITPQNGVSLKYIYYCLKGKNKELNAKGTGSTFKAIAKSALGETSVKIVSEEDQLKIIQTLDRVSSVIEARKQQLTELDNLIKARFVELFGDTILNPFGWKKDLLGTVCDVRDGTHDSPQYYESGYPLVTSKNVTGGKIDLTDCSLICEADFKKISERSKVDIGDIIMPMIGTVGKPVIVDIEPNFAIKNVSLIKFKADSRVLNTYIRALLQSDYFDDAVLSKVRGGTQKFISLGDIRKLEVLVPPMELQEQFATFIKQTDKSKLAVQQSLDKLELLKKNLMQKYFG